MRCLMNLQINRKKGYLPSKTINDFDATITITPDEINNQRYLIFDGMDGMIAQC